MFLEDPSFLLAYILLSPGNEGSNESEANLALKLRKKYVTKNK